MKLSLALAASLLLPAPAFACDEMREMREALKEAQKNTASARRATLESRLGQAEQLMGVMNDYLSLKYFPGLFVMREDAFELTVPDNAEYRAIAGSLPFLQGAAGAKITLKPGKERSEQFEKLKALYLATLERAADSLKKDEDAALRRRLWGLAEWGAQSSVEDGASESVPVLTREQRDRVLAVPAPAPADPHE